MLMPHASRLGSTLHYEFYEDGLSKEESESEGGSTVAGLQVIHFPHAHLQCSFTGEE